MTAQLFNAILLAYLSTEKAMLEAKAARFTHHCVVYVACPRFNGYGIVVLEDGCPPGELAVLIENGNVWRYLAQACQPVADRKQHPRWIRRKLTQWKRIENRIARERPAKCPNDTDGDGDCHICAGNSERCAHRSKLPPWKS